MAKQRGNPQWCRSGRAADVPNTPTAFEQFVAARKLQPEQYPHSKELRRFVAANYRRKYIPEDVLKRLGYDLVALSQSVGGY